MNGFVSFLSGLIFAIGLGVSQMTLPTKVIGFLDLTGNWDPSLAFVMIGAIGVHFIAYQIKGKMEKPKLADSFDIPSGQQLNGALIIGSILFGMGWGLGGFCPGPALVATISLIPEVLIFSASMLLGFGLFSIFGKKKTAKEVTG